MTRFTFECLVCGMFFPLRRKFQAHVESEHLRKWPEKDIPFAEEVTA